MSSFDDMPCYSRRMVAVSSAEDVGAAIRSARRARGLTQAELARRAGIGRQWLIAVEQGHDRAEIGMVASVLRHLELALEVAPARATAESESPTWLTARELAEALRTEIARGDTAFALRLTGRALADLRRLKRADEIAAFLAPPPSTGDRRWDTLVAAAVGRECRLLGIDAPAWTHVPPLATWWFPVFDPVLAARTFQHTPVDFAARGIWLDERALAIV